MANAARDDAVAPHDIDVYVGRKLRRAREAAGMTQAQLASVLGVSFQQLQKYERADNRISAGRLWVAGRVLQHSPNDFFPPADSMDDDTGISISPQAATLVRHFNRIQPARARQAVIRLVKAIAGRGTGRSPDEAKRNPG